MTDDGDCPYFNDGEEVILLAFEDEPEQRGTILNWQGKDLYTVSLHDEYREPGDDGLREVLSDQLRRP